MKSLGRTSRLILTVLARGPAHGYGVIRWVKDVSGGSEQLAVGSVYGSMDKLEGQGHIEYSHDEVEAGRTRRYFQITESGRTRLQREVRKLSSEVEAARDALNTSQAELGGIAGDLT